MLAALGSRSVKGAAAVLALAAATLAVARPAVGYDALNWIIWGREIVQGGFDTRGGTAWKPLPVVFTVLLAPAGGATPVLWLVVARATALTALAGVVRVGARLGGAVTAGILAGVALVAVGDNLLSFWTGTADWLVLAPAVWAVDAALAGRRMPAFALACVAGLVRPEAWVFVGLAGAWAVRERRSRLPAVLAVAVAVPLAWLLPEWAGSGSPLGGQDRVLHSPGAIAAQASTEPWRLVLVRFRDVVGRWLGFTALAGAVLELRSRRPHLALLLAGAALWVAVVAAMAQLGYPGLARFMLPAALAVSVAAGVAVGRAVANLEVRGPPGALVAVVLVGVWLVPVVDRAVPNLHRQQLLAERAVHEQSDLAAVVNRAGGPQSVLGCGAPRTWWAAEPLVHWMLDPGAVPPHRGGVVLIRERRRDRHGFVPPAPTRTRLRLLAAGRLWELQGRCARD